MTYRSILVSRLKVEEKGTPIGYYYPFGHIKQAEKRNPNIHEIVVNCNYNVDYNNVTTFIKSTLIHTFLNSPLVPQIKYFSEDINRKNSYNHHSNKKGFLVDLKLDQKIVTNLGEVMYTVNSNAEGSPWVRQILDSNLAKYKIIYGIASLFNQFEIFGIKIFNFYPDFVFISEFFEPKFVLYNFMDVVYKEDPIHYVERMEHLLSSKKFRHEGDPPQPLYFAFNQTDVSNTEFLPKSNQLLFAFIIYFLFTGVKDISRRSNGNIVLNYQRGEKPERSIKIPDNYWNIIENCWRNATKKRPHFAEILKTLESEEFLSQIGLSQEEMKQVNSFKEKLDFTKDCFVNFATLKKYRKAIKKNSIKQNESFHNVNENQDEEGQLVLEKHMLDKFLDLPLMNFNVISEEDDLSDDSVDEQEEEEDM